MDATVNMVWWGVDRHDFERFRTRIFEIVLRARRYDEHIARCDRNGLVVERGFARPALEVESLFDMRMRFLADFAAWRDPHDDKLGKFPCKKNVTEVVIRIHFTNDIGSVGHSLGGQVDSFFHSTTFPASISTGWAFLSVEICERVNRG